jgi:phosphate transport system permease protein
MTSLAPAPPPVPAPWRAADADRLELRSGTLPRWATYAVAGVTAAVLAVAYVLTPLDSYVLPIVAFVPLFTLAIGVLSARLEGRRRAKDRVVTSAVYTAFALAIIPLVSVLATVVSRGLERLSPYFLTVSMRNVGPRDDAGGIYHAIVGTVQQVGLASVVAVPLGILTAVYLVEYGRGRLARSITFFVDVMTGVPSIVAGLFIFSLWILTFGFDYMGWAGAMALSILMLPVVVRSTETMLGLVPAELREASLALGVPRWVTILRVVIPTALTGIITGVMLAVARIIGETAPLLLTVFFATSINYNPFSGPQVALPQYVYDEAQRGLEIATDRAWAAALTLILIVMLLNLLARGIAHVKAPSGR